MKRLAWISVPTVLAFVGLVPLQATALANVLDVEVETANRVTASDDCLMDNDDCIHVLTATVTDAGAPPATEVDISFELEGGPSDPDPLPDPGFVPDATCTTVGGICQVSLHSSTEGTDPVRAWIEDGNPLPTEVDMDEGRDEAAEAGDPEPDVTDVVEVSWFDGVLNVEPEEATFAPSSGVSFEAEVLENQPPAGETAEKLLANVDAEILTGSPNANQQPTEADAECDTAQATGKCNLTYTAGTGVGVDTVRGWIDLNDAPNAATPTGDEQSGTGYEGDNTETATTEGTGDGAAITDVVRANISSTPVLTATPSNQTKMAGQTATVTASVTTGGAPQNAQRVAAVVLPGGPNAGKSLSCNTGATGTCDLLHTSTAPGTDKLRLWVDANGDGQPDEADVGESDVGATGNTPEPDTTTVVNVTWTGGTTQPTPPPPAVDTDCEQAKQKVAKLKKKLKKAKKADNEAKIKRLKKKLKRARAQKRAACAT